MRWDSWSYRFFWQVKFASNARKWWDLSIFTLKRYYSYYPDDRCHLHPYEHPQNIMLHADGKDRHGNTRIPKGHQVFEESAAIQLEGQRELSIAANLWLTGTGLLLWRPGWICSVLSQSIYPRRTRGYWIGNKKNFIRDAMRIWKNTVEHLEGEYNITFYRIPHTSYRWFYCFSASENRKGKGELYQQPLPSKRKIV